MAGGWAGSTRKSRLPRGWAGLRARILARDGHRCTRLEDGQRCTQHATDVDHIDRGAGDYPANLASLCSWHHAQKTAAEGNAARTRTRRPAEPHPGLDRP